MAEDILTKIVEQRKADIKKSGFSFGIKIPEKRNRPIVPFMNKKSAILEVKRASPSKGDIAPDLNAVETAKKYRIAGAKAISCLTEKNYFKGSLQDLIDICSNISDIAVLRKDFLIDENEIEISYLCGADAVLLIAGILTEEKLYSMTKNCFEKGIKALVEVRSLEDAKKVLAVKKDFDSTIVCGVNSRNLKDFSMDLLFPCALKNILGSKVIFESGITTPAAARRVSEMGFQGFLMGEAAARNPENVHEFIKEFEETSITEHGKKICSLAEKILSSRKKTPLVKICGITNKKDLLFADKCGADFVGFVFAGGFERNVCGTKFDLLKDSLKSVKAFKVAVVTDLNSSEGKEAVRLVKEGLLDFLQLHGIDFEKIDEDILTLPHYFTLCSKSNIDEKKLKKLYSFGETRILQECSSHNYQKTNGLWIAGGLNADNISSFIKEFSPELVDVSSGIENEIKGIKNHSKMKKFFDEIKKSIKQ